MTGSKHLISTQEIILLNEERLRYVKLANLYVDNIEAAKDIFQDCILHIYSIKDRLYLSDARNYFAAVVMNRSRDYLKKGAASGTEKYEMTAENLKSLSMLPDKGCDAVWDVDFPKLLDDCRKKLTPLSFEIFEAKRFGGLSHKQISEMFGISERSVKYELSKAQQVFREVFRDYGVFAVVSALYLLSLSSCFVEKDSFRTIGTASSVEACL